jgi:molybdate transport system ATP-binding protein
VTLAAVVQLVLGELSLDVECSVDDGEILAVLGPNGAGKSTLLRALAGLLAIDAGQITISGTVVDDPARDVFVAPDARSVGVVFQDYLLFPHLRALDNVAFGLRERGVRKADARERARAVMAEVGAEVFATARPRELSGGQAQRVALARALAVEPSLLLLDEPLAALDVRTRVDTRRQLRTMLRRHCTVFVTHDPIDALTLADRLLIVEDGRAVQTGTAAEVAARPQSQYVAELVGVNLYRGRAAGELLHVGDAVLTTASPMQGPAMGIVAPHAVVLHRSQPEGSARNAFPGRITGIEPLGGRMRVRVHGALPIVAEVTPAAVAAMDLREGLDVWAAVKATEVEVHPTSD